MQECVYCHKPFQPKNRAHAICSDACRRAMRGTEYRKQRELALYRDGNACTECGSTDNLECHHIQWLSKGGDHSLENLQTLCRPHHRAKHRNENRNTQNGPAEHATTGSESNDRATLRAA